MNKDLVAIGLRLLFVFILVSEVVTRTREQKKDSVIITELIKSF